MTHGDCGEKYTKERTRTRPAKMNWFRKESWLRTGDERRNAAYTTIRFLSASAEPPLAIFNPQLPTDSSDEAKTSALSQTDPRRLSKNDPAHQSRDEWAS